MMGFSQHNLVVQFQQLELVLAEDFQGWFQELRKNQEGGSSDEAQNFKLIEQLQFHDILRQKIEHIRQFWEARQGEEAAFEREDEDTILPEMTELAIALLRFTILEYEEVTAKMQGLLPDAIQLPEVGEARLFPELAKTLIKELEQLYLQLDVPEEEPGMASENRLKKVWESFSMKSERDVFSMLFSAEPFTEQDNETDNPQGQVELF